MLSGYPLTDAKFKNYQHSLFSHPDVQDYHMDNLDMFELSKDVVALLDKMSKAVLFFTQHIYEVDVVKELYERRNEFDLFIFDRGLNEVRQSMKKCIRFS